VTDVRHLPPRAATHLRAHWRDEGVARACAGGPRGGALPDAFVFLAAFIRELKLSHYHAASARASLPSLHRLTCMRTAPQRPVAVSALALSARTRVPRRKAVSQAARALSKLPPVEF